MAGVRHGVPLGTRQGGLLAVLWVGLRDGTPGFFSATGRQPGFARHAIECGFVIGMSGYLTHAANLHPAPLRVRKRLAGYPGGALLAARARAVTIADTSLRAVVFSRARRLG